MGHVASGDNAQDEMLFQQEEFVESEFMVIPTTPNNTPEVAMTDRSETNSPHEYDASERVPTSHNRHESARHSTENDEDPRHEDGNYISETETTTDNEDPYASFDPVITLLIPITNPSAFPIQRLQAVQSQRQPSTRIINIWCHKAPSGPIIQVTADIQDGPINHLLIRDGRWISALGLTAPDYDTISFDATKLHLDETFTTKIRSGQRTKGLDEWIMGELIGARHAYLHWLDERASADPKHAPFAAEAKAIARKTGRRWPDVMREIERVWELEQGGEGSEYRENRMKYLGEDPTYPPGAEEQRVVRSMFG